MNERNRPEEKIEERTIEPGLELTSIELIAQKHFPVKKHKGKEIESVKKQRAAFMWGYKHAPEIQAGIAIATAIDFGNWLNNNWYVPTNEGMWKLEVDHPEFPKDFPKPLINLFAIADLFKKFEKGEGER